MHAQCRPRGRQTGCEYPPNAARRPGPQLHHAGDYYARTTKEQEDRDNAEARKRFLAQQQQQLNVNRPLKF
jgi:hypothetical protein